MFHHNEGFIDSNFDDGEDYNHRRYLDTLNGSTFSQNMHYDQFSFKLNHSKEIPEKSFYDEHSQSSNQSFRQNLQMMDKNDIIELFLQELKNTTQSKPFASLGHSQKPSPHHSNYDKNNQQRSQQMNADFKRQYEELVKGFQEYINNTRQAQGHFIRTIEDLRKENQQLHQKLASKNMGENQRSTKNLNSQNGVNEKNAMIIAKLQQTIQKYLEINNSLIGKVQKLQRTKEDDTKEIQCLKKAVEKLEVDKEMRDKQKAQLQEEIIQLRKSNKENLKAGGKLKESRDFNNEALNEVGGLKRSNSSVYDMKNSQQSSSTEAIKQPVKQACKDQPPKDMKNESKSAIRQAYNNCFKKLEERQNEIRQLRQKAEEISKESCYMPKMSQFCSKKSEAEHQQGEMNANEKVEGKVEQYGQIRKRLQF